MQGLVDVDDVFQLFQEPLVNLGEFVYLVDGIAFVHGFRDDEHAFVCGFAQCCIDVVDLQFLVFNKAVHTLSNHAQSLLDGLFEGATDGHYLANRLHRRAKFLVYAAKFAQVPTWYLADNVVEGGFEECAGGLCYRVFQFEKSVTHAQLGRNESQRIACGL